MAKKRKARRYAPKISDLGNVDAREFMRSIEDGADSKRSTEPDPRNAFAKAMAALGAAVLAVSAHMCDDATRLGRFASGASHYANGAAHVSAYADDVARSASHGRELSTGERLIDDVAADVRAPHTATESPSHVSTPHVVPMPSTEGSGRWAREAHPHVIAIVPTDEVSIRALYGPDAPASWIHDFAEFAEAYERMGTASVIQTGGPHDLYDALNQVLARDGVPVLIAHSEACQGGRCIVLPSGERVPLDELVSHVHAADRSDPSATASLIVFTCDGGDLAGLGTITHVEITSAYRAALPHAQTQDDLVQMMRTQIQGDRRRRVGIRVAGGTTLVVVVCGVSGGCE